jgi:hypothetical protein
MREFRAISRPQVFEHEPEIEFACFLRPNHRDFLRHHDEWYVSHRKAYRVWRAPAGARETKSGIFNISPTAELLRRENAWRTVRNNTGFRGRKRRIKNPPVACIFLKPVEGAQGCSVPKTSRHSEPVVVDSARAIRLVPAAPKSHVSEMLLRAKTGCQNTAPASGLAELYLLSARPA